MSKKLLGLLLYSALLQAQMSTAPQRSVKDLTENNSLKREKVSYVTEKTNKKNDVFFNEGTVHEVLCDTVSLSKKTKESIPKENKSVIYINGQYVVAQEVTVQMTSDFMSSATTGFAVPIGNLNKEIVDNESSYAGTDSANSFKVLEDGLYQINMTLQLSTTYGATPTIGIWDNNAMQWVASVKEQCTTPKNKLQTYTLTASKPMRANHTYSFRACNKFDFTIKNGNNNDLNSDNVSQVSVKRVK
ncbi:hypothetical protein [Flavobacterium hercynium]|uniref:Uncharacterized protein n=1 Tax=Flavobacterium hercynium TaxID=387094 RepID=A0A226HFU1_9FLAO|nr:hypothetical protein [Flavobacterium hercynium]OXA93147.1 hypothetical protein B0A66_07685 [Flavobacterium hercynium]SMP32764.1 hypothetical protein SAMN06265346_11584 [Flavobacterium hercynium]